MGNFNKKFIFHESYFQAIQMIKNNDDRAIAYDVICEYALNGNFPNLEKIPESAAIAFFLIQDRIELSEKRSIAGYKGGLIKKNNIVNEYIELTGKRLGKNGQEELREYEKKFGREICIRAISKAVEKGEEKTNWNYVRGILRKLEENNIESIEEWEKFEKVNKSIGKKQKNYNPSIDRIKKNEEWLDNFLEKQKK